MSQVEETVRPSRGDWKVLAPWFRPLARLAAAIRHRRRAATVTVVCVAGAVAFGVPAVRTLIDDADGSGVVGADGVVPWKETPAAQPAHLAHRSPRPDARDCRPEDLGRTAWFESTQDPPNGVLYIISLANKSDSRCTLRGEARLTAATTTVGRRTTTSQPEPVSALATHQYPATIDPGEPARIDLRTSSQCVTGTATTYRYRDLRLSMPGFDASVPGLPLNTGCIARTGSWYVRPPLLNAPSQVVSIDAPAQVRRGDVLTYTVTVTNPSDQTLRLDPCPPYTQRLGDRASTYLLNCYSSSIAPHKSRRFEMKFPVPADSVVGPTTLSWMAVLKDGTVAVADLATDGVAVRVTD
jgi:hypothetical protein